MQQYDFGQDVKVAETCGGMTVFCGSYHALKESLHIGLKIQERVH
jgi:hypothetical protein